MEYINRNEELIQQSFAGGYYILDSMITRFDIYIQDYILFIDVYFSLPRHRFKADKNLKLHFIDVKEYEFYWNDQYHFYTVERYKFFKSEKGYYLSVDPYDESEVVLDDDHGIIFSREVEGYFI
jgi:hypothetical protein